MESFTQVTGLVVLIGAVILFGMLNYFVPIGFNLRCQEKGGPKFCIPFGDNDSFGAKESSQDAIKRRIN